MIIYGSRATLRPTNGIPPRPLHAIVIGGGFGGLAAANRLQSMGVQVTLLEKRSAVGGRAYRFQEDGYTFDMGPTLVTAPDLIDRIFVRAGRSLDEYVDLVPLDPFYRVYFHDETFIDYTGIGGEMKAQMASFNAGDAARYDGFMGDVEPIFEAVMTEGLGNRPFDSVWSMLNFLPRALRLKAYQPVAAFAKRYFDDFRHQFLFSFHPLFIGGNPFRAPSVYAMIPYLEREQGVWFARGGMYRLVKAFEQLLIDQGGAIQTGAAVDEIVIRGGVARGVSVADEFYPADLVVSNAGAAHTYGELVSPQKSVTWTPRRLANLDYSMSCFLVYLGVRRRYPKLKHHTIIVNRRYRELVTDIFDRKILPDDFSMYLHVPSKTDPSMAPPGAESMYVLVPVPNLRSGIDWSKEAGPFADRILTFLEEWGLHDLRRNTAVRRRFTPDDFASELNAAYGHAFGVEPRLTQTAYFRPHNSSEDFDRLYLVGADTHPGAGIPGVLLSAEATEYALRKEMKAGCFNVRNE